MQWMRFQMLNRKNYIVLFALQMVKKPSIFIDFILAKITVERWKKVFWSEDRVIRLVQDPDRERVKKNCQKIYLILGRDNHRYQALLLPMFSDKAYSFYRCLNLEFILSNVDFHFWTNQRRLRIEVLKKNGQSFR